MQTHIYKTVQATSIGELEPQSTGIVISLVVSTMIRIIAKIAFILARNLQVTDVGSHLAIVSILRS